MEKCRMSNFLLLSKLFLIHALERASFLWNTPSFLVFCFLPPMRRAVSLHHTLPVWWLCFTLSLQQCISLLWTETSDTMTQNELYVLLVVLVVFGHKNENLTKSEHGSKSGLNVLTNLSRSNKKQSNWARESQTHCLHTRWSFTQ